MPQDLAVPRVETPNDSPASEIPLRMLGSGQSAEVSQLLGRPDQVQRLKELGFVAGTLVEMIQTGAPCILRLGERKLGFRATELANVLVRLRHDR